MEIHEVVIIGGGPAGISCALECIENKLSPCILERNQRIGGQLPDIPSPISNFSGGLYKDGKALRDDLEKIARKTLTGHIKTGVEVTEVDLLKRKLTTNSGAMEVGAFVLATGYRVRRLPLELANTFGEDILYRSGACKELLANKNVGVVGGGDSAFMTALDLAERSKTVHLIVRSDHFKARPDVARDVMNHPSITIHNQSSIRRLVGRDSLSGVDIDCPSGLKHLQVDKLIVKIGYVPNTELFRGQIDMDESGHIKAGPTGETSLAHVFASGDILHCGYDRIAYATGSGIMAAKGVRRFLGHNV
ncbi:MAG: NAD(P)/FAD-dependent oxidoreductase [Candidatus Obscuribacterales bacterium]|nr:NAD(P)/FAD-dependent oxidoreductase [Candidatus Obscuribacterales bacterium]